MRRTMRRFWILGIVLTACAWIAGGCASRGLGYGESRVWSYAPERHAEITASPGPSLVVLPFEDNRRGDNTNHLLYAFIPGVFYADMDYSHPEAPVPHLLSGTEWKFSPPEDLRRAAAAELEASGIFQAVRLGTDPEAGELVLEGTVYKTQYTGRVFTYFASVGGPLFGWWFLPEGMVAGKLEIDLQLKDPQTGSVIHRQIYEQNDEGDLFWIWGKASDFPFPDLMHRLMAAAVTDFRQTLAARKRPDHP